ncbi:cupin domain-containing protein [Mesosutterella sp. OilRF-GAM-744-9]|uniref:Cupin domain-containing protein n=2 Tax=Mesosutterella TaxID=2494213 RepID=A0ABS9MS93_9BURK|nr:MULTISPECIES: cupin domain-containing protein [unclassified Mesosutterella]MCG5031496.1 cupin domain-containing protein [Mesosutterella sp. oilRF-744-WT-GAM-9]MCI6529942.1 cupin domain-containing protein [Mesosutterella sp.]MDL2060218.1 cupin domain-containing protein [Mesosutterella sp. AGMB02718]
MTNFKVTQTDVSAPRVELHDALSLTSAEVSVNRLPAGSRGVPFVHRHTGNEEIYVVTEGSGELYVDGTVTPIKAGTAFRIDPQGARAIRASDKEGLTYICIQARAGSLQGFTMTDGQIVKDQKAPWQ